MWIKQYQLTLIEYAVPSTKLVKRAQNSGHEPTIHPSQKLCKWREEMIRTLKNPDALLEHPIKIKMLNRTRCVVSLMVSLVSKW